jgi:hypothetical protein
MMVGLVMAKHIASLRKKTQKRFAHERSDATMRLWKTKCRCPKKLI